MNQIERGLKRLGEEGGRGLPDRMAPRPDALRRIRRRRRVLSGSVALCTFAVVAGGVALSGGPPPEVTDVKPADDERTPGPDEPARCGITFEPTYLPPGFEAEPRAASGGNEELPAESPYPVAHFRGPRGTFVDVLAGRSSSSPGSFAQTRREAIGVLGTRGSLGDVHEGYSVEFRFERCSYELLGYGIARSELRAFAEGLVSTTERPPHFQAVWPEDTLAEARQGCYLHRNRREPRAVARRFAEELLRWVDPRPVVSDPRSHNGTVEMTISYDAVRAAGVEPGVRMWMGEVLPGCWSVVSVSPLHERRVSSLSVGVDGRAASIYFGDRGATSATIEFGYGTHESTTTWHEGGDDVTQLPVSGGRSQTGHFLVLLRNPDGTPYAAIGRPLPPGDFAAG